MDIPLYYTIGKNKTLVVNKNILFFSIFRVSTRASFVRTFRTIAIVRRYSRYMDAENKEYSWGRTEGERGLCGNADICQEIDNSNKLIAKHSNRLPNGTIAHSNPRHRAKHRISSPLDTQRRIYVCRLAGVMRARPIQCAYYLSAGILCIGNWTDYERICWTILFRLVIKSRRRLHCYYV